jgi:ATP-dependent 26S proteasome regulatory subunit
MQIGDIYGMTLFFNTFKNLTGNEIYDTIILGIISFAYFFIDFKLIQKKISLYFLSFKKKGEYTVLINAVNDMWPTNFKSVLWYISQNKDIKINCLEQLSSFRWNQDDILTQSESIYIVSQYERFKINKDISCQLVKSRKESSLKKDVTEYNDKYELFLYSKHPTHFIINFINDITTKYNQYIKNKMLENQMNLSISYEKKIQIKPSIFDSSITFENSYIPNKHNILKKIDFFLNNKEWYQKKGIPYNLGILLYGQPGCGKTRFIKQLLNHTKRHGIDIKLNNEFDFTELKNIIHNEKISDEYIIPQDKRIIIFEDIDAMCSILKDRDIKNENSEIKNENSKEDKNKNSKEDKNDKSMLEEKKKYKNNNLSYFLNIIDGLNECFGRIIIMTTNNVDYLDKAIIRPGRIDIKLNFGKYSKMDVCNMINHFWEKDISVERINDDVHYKYTSAELMNIFRTSDDFSDIMHHFI